MKKVVVVCFLTGLQLASWADNGRASASAENDRLTSVCDFPEIAASSVGRKLRVRGKMTLHAHGIFLSDLKCPDVRIHLKSIPGGPDVSLCSLPELVDRFGCPTGGDAGPLVTAVGVLRNITEPSNGFLLVEELSDFEKAEDAERH